MHRTWAHGGPGAWASTRKPVTAPTVCRRSGTADDGSDQLFGLAGDDVLAGGAGDDALDGGSDIDECRGDEGTDSAVNCETVESVP
jgi:Ca2+-binding RTX toxin-like protein